MVTSEPLTEEVSMRWIDRLFKLEEINGHGRCSTYLYRWTLLAFRRLSVYLHHFVGDDWSRDMHDHPIFLVPQARRVRLLAELLPEPANQCDLCRDIEINSRRLTTPCGLFDCNLGEVRERFVIVDGPHMVPPLIRQLRS